MKEFNAGEPIAYFFTWTTYGTWLPGDHRGWNPKDGSGPQTANQLFEEMARSQMTEPEFHLCTVDRELVEQVIRKHCEIRQWTLHAVNPRSNHVHVVVTAPGDEPEPVYEQFKAWCTRHLKVNHKERENFWTERASRRWINHDEDLKPPSSTCLKHKTVITALLHGAGNTSPTRQRVRFTFRPCHRCGLAR